MKTRLPLLLLFLLVGAAGFAAGRGVRPAGELGLARIWHGRVANAKAVEYEKYLYEGGVTKMRARPSNLGVQVFRKTDGAFTDFLVVSYWPSRDSVREWAGADIDQTRYLDRDKEYLVELEPLVQHYDIIVSEGKVTK